MKGSNTLMQIRTVNLDQLTDERFAEVSKIASDVAGVISTGDFTEGSFDKCLKNSYCELSFVSDEKIREENKEMRQIDKVTDCLSFPLIEMNNGALTKELEQWDFEQTEDGDTLLPLGDILIDLNKASLQAEEYGHSETREIAFLIAHSVLHLLGYDHIEKKQEKVMIEAQKKIMAAMGLASSEELEEASLNEMTDHSDDIALPAGTPCDHCGYCAIIGRPNVGKSTLINYITGMKVAIVSHKPQTTRTNIRTIYNTSTSQIIFVDTPGVHNPDSKMNRIMVDKSFNSAIQADVVLLMADARFNKPGSVESRLIELCKENNKKVILAINKEDELKGDNMLPVIGNYASLYDFTDIVPISAKTGRNVDTLLNVITEALPSSPRLFDSEYMTDQTEREIASELIREQILHYTDQEVPHGCAVNITGFKEKSDNQTDEYDRDCVVIQADIICERDSHKGIIIGKNGQMIKRIGTAARKNIERMLGCKVFLELYVKVRSDWQNNDTYLREFGLSEEDE